MICSVGTNKPENLYNWELKHWKTIRNRDKPSLVVPKIIIFQREAELDSASWPAIDFLSNWIIQHSSAKEFIEFLPAQMSNFFDAVLTRIFDTCDTLSVFLPRFHNYYYKTVKCHQLLLIKLTGSSSSSPSIVSTAESEFVQLDTKTRRWATHRENFRKDKILP